MSSEGKIKYTVVGFTSCSYYQNALSVAKQVAVKNKLVEVENIPFLTRGEYKEWVSKNLLPKGIAHQTSPAVFKNDVFLGGNDDFVASVEGQYDSESSCVIL